MSSKFSFPAFFDLLIVGVREGGRKRGETERRGGEEERGDREERGVGREGRQRGEGGRKRGETERRGR